MKTWHSMDKSRFGVGPWLTEPDKAQWIDEETDLDCLIVRNYMGALCGYVGIASGHPLYGLDYSKIPEIEEVPHGGLTYADFCQKIDDPSHGICHIPEEGRPEKIWWFGFDCAHGCDFVPAVWDRFSVSVEMIFVKELPYRDIEYVKSEVKLLAKSLKMAEKLEK